MKVIVSHDVDHITAWEHWHDLIIPKFLVRSLIEYKSASISINEVWRRVKSLTHNKWQNLDDLMAFDKMNQIPSTFFVGVAKGLGLAYSEKNAHKWIRNIKREGFEVGVHGLAFDHLHDMQAEKARFLNAGCDGDFGIRMHYLRSAPNTLKFLDRAGYYFDSSTLGLARPFKVGAVWEFPLHIMDCYIMIENGKWQNRSLDQSKSETIALIEAAQQKDVQYLTVSMHDSYFSECFETWKQWYMWLIDYLKCNMHSFINYHEAINELEVAEPVGRNL